MSHVSPSHNTSGGGNKSTSLLSQASSRLEYISKLSRISNLFTSYLLPILIIVGLFVSSVLVAFILKLSMDHQGSHSPHENFHHAPQDKQSSTFHTADAYFHGFLPFLVISFPAYGLLILLQLSTPLLHLYAKRQFLLLGESYYFDIHRLEFNLLLSLGLAPLLSLFLFIFLKLNAIMEIAWSWIFVPIYCLSALYVVVPVLSWFISMCMTDYDEVRRLKLKHRIRQMETMDHSSGDHVQLNVPGASVSQSATLEADVDLQNTSFVKSLFYERSNVVLVWFFFSVFNIMMCLQLFALTSKLRAENPSQLDWTLFLLPSWLYFFMHIVGPAFVYFVPIFRKCLGLRDPKRFKLQSILYIVFCAFVIVPLLSLCLLVSIYLDHLFNESIVVVFLPLWIFLVLMLLALFLYHRFGKEDFGIEEIVEQKVFSGKQIQKKD